jgi:hypothetical protein
MGAKELCPARGPLIWTVEWPLSEQQFMNT